MVGQIAVDQPGKSVLLTGAAGFVGWHMSYLLLKRGYRVFALDRGCEVMAEGVIPIPVDLCDPKALALLPRRWFAVIHLAAASIPSQFSTVTPVLYNMQITLNLFEHLEEARVLLVSSCHVYAPSSQPHKETAALVPQGLYGLSKHLCEQIVPHYQGKLDIRTTRPFNHLGPGQRAELVIPSLLRSLVAHPKDEHEHAPVTMKGINSVRDFIDVRDVVQAYLAILELEDPKDPVFNICTGKGQSIESLVLKSLSLLGLQRPVIFQNHRNSSDDIPHLVGDPSRLRDATGWAPTHTLADSLWAMINFIKARNCH